MKKVNIAILGATGAVGKAIIKALEERDYPVGNVKFFAAPSEEGSLLQFKGKSYPVEVAAEKSFDGTDVTFIAVGNDLCRKYMPLIQNSGSLAIDNSSAFRLDEQVPLVIPEINPNDALQHKGIIANPNCSTIIGLVAINKLHEYGKVNRMIVSTYQAVSGAGEAGISELKESVNADLNGQEYNRTVFKHQIGFNLIPCIDEPAADNYTKEELKMVNEGRKILHDNNIGINCTCVRVPVIRSHSESITIDTEKEITVDKAREILSSAPGVKLVDELENGKYPMPKDTSNQDLIHVGRIRRDLSSNNTNSLTLWCSGDQIRKGAATNAVQIAEVLLEREAI